MPYTCSVEDGLFIIRAAGVIRMADVEELAGAEDGWFKTPGCSGLILFDNSELKVISPDGADALVDRMRLDNARFKRSAFVVGEGTAALQLKRMVREGGSRNRVVFPTEAQARAWLLRSA